MTAPEKVTIDSKGLKLTGRFRPGAKGAMGPAVIICHPHPLFGGSMDNNVVYALEGAIFGMGLSTLCFNFRGAGSSQGSYDEMRGEVDDVLAALDFLARRDEVDPTRVGLAGYSFGGLMAMYAASRLVADPQSSPVTLKALALISPMSPGIPWDQDPKLADLLRNPPPALIATGTQDQFCPLKGAQALVSELGMNTRLIVIEGADHFHGGREDESAQPSADLFSRLL
jgi:hypothetical protein